MSVGLLRLFGVWFVAAGCVLRPGAAFGAASVDLTLEQCANLSGARLEHLLCLELNTLGGGEADTSRAHVTLQCAGQSITVIATEPGTPRKLSRAVALDSQVPDPERVLAISAAQLVRALGWLPNEPPTAPPTPAPKASVVLHRSTFPLPPVGLGARVDLSGGARARALSRPLLLIHTAAGVGFLVARSLRLGGELMYESGSADRLPGNANARLFGGGLWISWLLQSGRYVLLEARATASVCHATLSGKGPRPQSTTRSLAGFGADFGVDFGPALRLGALSLRLAAAAGAASFGGRGLVTGDDAVTLNGAWVGSELSGRVNF